MNHKKSAFILTLSLTFMSLGLWAKGDIAKGKAKAVTCIACHGPKGISSNPLWPNLAGQKKEYLIKQIRAFKSGERKKAPMLPMVMSLTEEDIKNLAAYYSSLKCSP